MLVVSSLGFPAHAEENSEPPATAGQKVSFYKQIRPIFQARCHGCHQPAKADGRYVMTSFESLLKGGKSGEAAIVPGKPEESFLLDLILPLNGKAKMPKNGKPLSDAEIELIEKWIEQGAENDTPPNAEQRFDQDHPPVYSLPPVITSIDYSPDGRWLAVAGFHEVLLHKADGSGLVARLVGLSERIESVRFSPDGKYLAVSGGQPCRMGEIQIWDVAKRSLKLSVPVTYDTLYGVNWSPDGKLVSFGCADTTVRAIEAETGRQVLFQGAHNDWVLDTVFSKDGTHLISVDRAGTAKLTEVATERFVDNITSITPGALKGGIQAVARHPQRDEILVGSSAGVPQLFQVFRKTKRVIGDNANLLREFDPMPGRIFAVDISPDGKLLAAGSSLDGRGYIHVYAYDFNTEIPKDLLPILQKTTQSRSAEEKKKVAAFRRQGIRRVADIEIPSGGVFTLAFSPDGKTLAAAGADGFVRLFERDTGKLIKQFMPVEVTGTAQFEPRPIVRRYQDDRFAEPTPADFRIVGLDVLPPQLTIDGPYDEGQLVVMARTAGGDAVDVTRAVTFALSNDAVTVTRRGRVWANHDGETVVTVRLKDQTASARIVAKRVTPEYPIDFIKHVNPVLSKIGCNAGTCHGAKEGKNGFKLSLRGYDPIFDTRSFTDDHKSRRANIAVPDKSLMLLKASGSVPHVGGQLTTPGEAYYEVIRRWIALGARLDPDTPRVTAIEFFPKDPIIQREGQRQQLRVVATYSDGSQRDVTRDAVISSGNTEVAEVVEGGLVTAIRRGEAPILARYEGQYAATTLTVMGDRDGFQWVQRPVYNFIDELVDKKLQRMKIVPSDLCTDAEFIRRVYLDLTGLPPSADAVKKFLADDRPSREKRAALVDELIGSPEFVDHWTNKWADLLQVNSKFLGREGAMAYYKWIRRQIEQNVPYDKFVYQILTATGSNIDNPPASYWKIHRTPQDAMENTTQLFLAIRFNCNKCHDHPFERWTQDQYYHLGAYFAQFTLKPDPKSGKRRIGGTAVEGAKPLFEIVEDRPQGDLIHLRTGQPAQPQFPYEVSFRPPASKQPTRRELLAAWITSPDNPYFARSYVNRIWGYLLGRGLIEPLDDIRAGNPPTNPELLDRLTAYFIEHGFDTRALMRLICTSRTYQLSIKTNPFNEDDQQNYSHALPKRLPAEVLFDAIYFVTGSTPQIPGVPAGTRAQQLYDSNIKLPDGFLANLGRPPRESACECERTSSLQLGPVMALVSGPTVGRAISDPKNAIARLVDRIQDDRQLVNELFLQILNRPATEAETRAFLETLQSLRPEHEALVAQRRSLEEKLRPTMERLEAERQKRIAAAKAALGAYRKQIQPKLDAAKRKQAERIADIEKRIQQRRKELDAGFQQWQQRVLQPVRWTALKADSLKSSFGAKLAQTADGSILVTGNNGRGHYEISGLTDVAGITALRLEVLPDDKLPRKGPGRAGDGNFVLTELEVKAAAQDAGKPANVSLIRAVADFSQNGYDVKTAIDGNRANVNNGWAIAPQMGKPHAAVFELGTDLGKPGTPTRLTILMHQLFRSNQHTIGKFRWSVTNHPRPVPLDKLPQNILAILRTPAEKRSKKQQDELAKFYRDADGTLAALRKQLAEAKKPLPADPKLKELEAKLAEASKPVPVDPELAELRRAVELSTRQLQNARLTVAQDLAWALINSPAFLFNH
ncbi:MAG: DUF1553 domain-containing protein [Planctomycetota bacterium]|nr:MAG: DUF1553 domain-containing protein [Planctomycetota bacterium]